MKNINEIRWIQFSDLHMFEYSESNRQLKWLLDSRRKFKDKIDFVVVTGDLHQYKEPYNITFEFLKKLCKQWELEREDIIIVPGNHDAILTEERAEAIAEVDKSIEVNVDAYKTERKNLYTGFKEYCRAIREFYGVKDRNDKLLKTDLYVWRDKLEIVRVNTAIVSDRDHNKPQIIDVEQLEQITDQNLPCLVIMHHHYQDILCEQKIYMQKKFEELGVGAILCGHRHRVSEEGLELNKDMSIPCFCCPKPVSQPGDLWSDIGFLEYRWNLQSNQVKVVFHEWNRGKMGFIPTGKLEENSYVTDDGYIELKKSFSFPNKARNEDRVLVKEVVSDINLDEFNEKIQKKYLDNILDNIDDSKEKWKCAVDIMEQITTQENGKMDFNAVVQSIVESNKKYILSVKGAQGTGKSTFLTLIYYKIKKDYGGDVCPVLIDLHALNSYSKKTAKEILTADLKAVDDLMKKYQKKKFILLFDGADDYLRKTTDLEKLVADYVEGKSNNGCPKFGFCVGHAEYLPGGIRKESILKTFSNDAEYKLEIHKIEKQENEKINKIIKALLELYGFTAEQTHISVIKGAVNEYTIRELDYRTLLIILRVLKSNIDRKEGYQLGSCFYEYYLSEMKNDEKELFKHAEAAYNYIVLKNKNALVKLKYSKIIYNNGITIDFLLAYYFVCLSIKKNKLVELNCDFVFTASVNKFVKDLILNKYKTQQSEIVNNLIEVYQSVGMSMKSQICYILGRIQVDTAKNEATKFLDSEWRKMYRKWFADDKLKRVKSDIKNDLVLFRTISVSLIWLGYAQHQESFLRCILLNEKLNQINRGFHLEYYADKTYMIGESPTYTDNENESADRTMEYLMNNINKGFSTTKTFNKSVYLDIVTLYSIYQYRMGNEEIEVRYGKKLYDMAGKILNSTDIQSEVIKNYISSIRELLSENPYKNIMNELYSIKLVKRGGWVERKYKEPESIADHMYGCYVLANFLLPDNVQQCIDYEISDMENYDGYSKETILNMLLLHDLAEARTGDIVTPKKQKADVEEEKKFYNYYEFMCSFPHIYGLGNQKRMWDEFEGASTINAKVANDIDKIEAFIQAYMYKNQGEKVNLKEWKDYNLQHICTSLGKQIMSFMVSKIVGEDAVEEG